MRKKKVLNTSKKNNLSYNQSNYVNFNSLNLQQRINVNFLLSIKKYKLSYTVLSKLQKNKLSALGRVRGQITVRGKVGVNHLYKPRSLLPRRVFKYKSLATIFNNNRNDSLSIVMSNKNT